MWDCCRFTHLQDDLLTSVIELLAGRAGGGGCLERYYSI